MDRDEQSAANPLRRERENSTRLHGPREELQSYS